jgi:hypothetical protein
MNRASPFVLLAVLLLYSKVMAEGWNQFMALTPERQAVLDAELQYIHRYFLSLASEINAAAPLAEKRGYTYHAALQVAGQVDQLRRLLAGREEIQVTG